MRVEWNGVPGIFPAHFNRNTRYSHGRDAGIMLWQLVSAVSERGSGAEGSDERIANRSRSVTPPPSRRRKPSRLPVTVNECRS